jgi:anti-anti-sigma factor
MHPHPRPEIAVLSRDGTARVTLSGELDLDAAPLIHSTISRTLADPQVHRIDVDATPVSFCDISGLHALAAAHAQAARARVQLRLVGISPALRRVLDLTGISADTGFTTLGQRRDHVGLITKDRANLHTRTVTDYK